MSKITVNWVEVLLVALLVLGGMGTWLVVDEFVVSSMKAQVPPEEYYTLTSEVPRRQAELTAAQTQAEALQDELSKKRVEEAAQAAHLKSLEQAYPVLAQLSQAATSQPQEVRQMTEFLQAWTQAEQARLVSQALEVQVGDLITRTAELSDTLKTQMPSSLAYKQAEAQLSLALDELSEAHKALVAQRVETARLDGVLHAQSVLNSEAAATWESALQMASSAKPALSPLVWQGYISALVEQKVTQGEIASLESAMQDTLKVIEESSTALGKAQMQARRNYQLAQDTGMVQKASSAALSLFGIGGYLLFFYLVLKESQKYHKYIINFKTVFVGAGVLLAFLWGYQALGVMCSAALVTLGFIGLLILLTRELSTKPSPTSSQEEATQVENIAPAQPDDLAPETQPPALTPGIAEQSVQDHSQDT